MEVENLFFVYVITREATRDFERNFARRAARLRQAKDEEGLKAFVEQTFEPAKFALSERFDDAFRRLDADSVQQYRLRYILAKLTQFVDLKGFGQSDGTKWLGRYTSSGFEIEDIYPQNPSGEAVNEFGPTSDANVCNRIGNLLLVEKSIDASLGNRPFSKKRGVYLQSQLLLTRALSEQPKVDTHTKIDAAVAGIEPFKSWNEGTVGKRRELIRVLARSIWDVPSKPAACRTAMSAFGFAETEQAALAWLENAGWRVRNGDDIAHCRAHNLRLRVCHHNDSKGTCREVRACPVR